MQLYYIYCVIYGSQVPECRAAQKHKVMKAIDILDEISNEVSNANNHFCRTYCGYVNCIEESGYDSDNYHVSYHDGKIKRSDSVFVTNERLSCGKPNIIMKNEDDLDDCVYIYEVK